MSSKESCDSVLEIPTDEMNKKRLTLSLLKAIVYLCNVGGLIWWSIHSINTYNEWPTASKVVWQSGDNGNGKLRFPVVTICPRYFGDHVPLWNNQSQCKYVSWVG